MSAVKNQGSKANHHFKGHTVFIKGLEPIVYINY